MLHMDFSFFSVESIRGFTSTFVAICSATSNLFGFTHRIKHPPLDILKYIATTLMNHVNKVAFIRVDEYGVLEIFSEFMKKCYNTNSIVHTTGGDASYSNGKSESPDNTLYNITISLLLNSSHKKELWCFAYQYEIRLPC